MKITAKTKKKEIKGQLKSKGHEGQNEKKDILTYTI